MSGPIEVGQRWVEREHGLDACEVFSVTKQRGVEHRSMDASFSAFLPEAKFREFYRRVIPLRIRVGVTADGNWSAFGRSIGVTAGHIYMSPTDVVGEDIGDHGPIVAWHWITAEVPMPETEQGETRGEVEL